MYDELVEALRLCAKFGKAEDALANAQKAADAIEELTQAKEELAKQVAYWQAQLTQAMCGETLADLEKSRWIPVTETKKPKTYEPVLVVYIGWNDALPHRDCTAYWSENEGLWRWAETNRKVEVSVTHYMPLPPLPEPLKEEE